MSDRPRTVREEEDSRRATYTFCRVGPTLHLLRLPSRSAPRLVPTGPSEDGIWTLVRLPSLCPMGPVRVREVREGPGGTLFRYPVRPRFPSTPSGGVRSRVVCVPGPSNASTPVTSFGHPSPSFPCSPLPGGVGSLRPVVTAPTGWVVVMSSFPGLVRTAVPRTKCGNHRYSGRPWVLR